MHVCKEAYLGGYARTRLFIHAARSEGVRLLQLDPKDYGMEGG